MFGRENFSYLADVLFVDGDRVWKVADVDQEELLVGKIPDRKNVPEKPESLALVSVVDDDDVDVFVGFGQVGRLSLILIEERGRNRF